MSVPSWKEFLGLHDRVAPELYEKNQPVENSPYAGEIRKVMSELNLSAMFCVEGVPQIAILEQGEYDIGRVSKAHAALWNQGLASVLIVAVEDNVRVFSLAKTPGSPKDSQQFEERCLIALLEATATALKDYIYGVESGRLWREESKYFNPKERIDSVLLNNITTAQNLLVSKGLSAEEAQAILIQTMFIAYLEDRDIITPNFFASISKRKQQSLSDVLSSGDAGLLKRLFDQLRKNFNGDLFVAPCSFDKRNYPQCLKAETMNILHRFRKGQEEMTENGGQLRFWGYNFKFIPVELISAVYDRFLGHDENTRHEKGAYYTPVFLADTVISSIWDKIDDRVKAQGTALDPACGSGVFLVRTFQRFCEHQRRNIRGDTIPWDSLVEMLGRVQGRDLNGIAVRVAVFSLYVALLEEVSPPDIQKIAAKKQSLPRLWNKTLVQRDFFDEDVEALQVDVIVGNPPWISRRNTINSGKNWCTSRKLPMPSREEAWAFTWKALDHLTNRGAAAFLLPAMGFLHNHAPSSVNARARFFKKTRVLRVVNFSDLQRQLFDGATFPTALIVFQRDSHPDHDIDYKFDYWTPKADINLAIRRFITLSTIEKSKITSLNIHENPFIFKQRLWMRSPEAKLFDYLDSLPKIDEFVKTFRSRGHREDNKARLWTIGRGFEPYNVPGASSEDKESYKSKGVAKCKFLPAQAFTPISIVTSQLAPFGQSIVRRKGFEGGFVGPRVLMPLGFTASMRLRAAYVEEPLTFRGSIRAIVAPVEESERAKFMTAVLNSHLITWYSFHGTSSLGSHHPRIHQSELLKFPMPQPKHMTSPERARSIRKKLTGLVDRHRENHDRVLMSSKENERLLRKIDLLTYAYFGLSDEEITLIEDVVEHILPAIQPGAGSFPGLWETADSEERAVYANQLVMSLSDWFDKGRQLSIRLIGSNQDFGILQVQLHDSIRANRDAYEENVSTSFSEALESISDALNDLEARNFQTIPDLKIFVGKSLFLIKPMQRRFWLKSTALMDADSIASELETTIAKGMAWSAVS